MPQRDSIAQARLAYITAGQPPLAGPRRAVAGESDLDDALNAAESAIEAVVDPPAPEPPWWRFSLSRRHVVAVVILMLAGVLIAVGVMATSSATPVTIEVSTPAEPSPGPSAATAAPTPSLLKVHVLGAVHQPGVVQVPEGAIVEDAIVAAGGLRQDADPAQLNLAAPLSAGQQVIVGTQDQPQGEVRGSGDAESGGGDGHLINLNTATAPQLQELPGVGPVLAAAIIDWRERNGGFSDVADLQEVSGIGPKSFEKLAPLVTV